MVLINFFFLKMISRLCSESKHSENAIMMITYWNVQKIIEWYKYFIVVGSIWRNIFIMMERQKVSVIGAVCWAASKTVGPMIYPRKLGLFEW